VNFYSNSVLKARLPAIVGACVATVLMLTFHGMTFA
jgi:hypothetical protein